MVPTGMANPANEPLMLRVKDLTTTSNRQNGDTRGFVHLVEKNGTHVVDNLHLSPRHDLVTIAT